MRVLLCQLLSERDSWRILSEYAERERYQLQLREARRHLGIWGGTLAVRSLKKRMRLECARLDTGLKRRIGRKPGSG